MLRWTSSLQVPITPDETTGRYPNINLTQVGNDIWIFCSYLNHGSKTEMFVLNTSSNDMVKLKYDCPLTEEIVDVTSQNHMIYIWTFESWQKRQLHKLNIKTMEWEKMICLDCNFFSVCHIINDTMYVYIPIETRMISINLVAGKIKKNWDQKMFGECLYLDIATKGGELYFLDTHNDRRSVSKIDFENERLIQVFGSTPFDSEDCGAKMTRWANGYMITSNLNSESPIRHLEFFDFQKKEWSRAVIEDSIFNGCLLDTIEMDGVIYATLRTPGVKFEIRLLELKPKLSSICLLQIVDQIMELEDKMKIVIKLKNTLCIPLRKQLLDMIRLRMVEHELKQRKMQRMDLVKDQWNAIENEALIMIKEGILDSIMVDDFKSLFGKNRDNVFHDVESIESEVQNLLNQ